MNLRCSSTSNLTDDDFTHASTDYEVTQLLVRSSGRLDLTFDTNIATGSENLILDVAGTEFAFEDADLKGTTYRRWNNAGLSWSVGDTIAVKLLEPAANNDAAPPAGPVVTLVSNTAQTTQGESSIFDSIAQQFTTGAAGYRLSSITARLSTRTGDALTATLRSSTAAGLPGSVLHTLASPTLKDGLNVFTAPSGATLAANTPYFFVLNKTTGTS